MQGNRDVEYCVYFYSSDIAELLNFAKLTHMPKHSTAVRLSKTEQRGLHGLSRMSKVDTSIEVDKSIMIIKPVEFDEVKELSHERDLTQLIKLNPVKDGVRYNLVYTVEAVNERKIVRVRSPLQVGENFTRF